MTAFHPAAPQWEGRSSFPQQFTRISVSYRLLDGLHIIIVIRGNSNIYLLQTVLEKENIKSCITTVREPNKHSSTMCQASTWFHAFKKQKQKKTKNKKCAIKKNIFIFVVCILFNACT